MVPGPLLRNVFRIIHLDCGRIDQHNAGEVACGVGTIDVALVSLTAEIGKVPAMINVGVAQHHGIDCFGIKRELAISLYRLIAPALE
jgi:hypothetical protein